MAFEGCGAKIFSPENSLWEIFDSNLVHNPEKDATIARQIVSNSLKMKAKDNLEENRPSS